MLFLTWKKLLGFRNMQEKLENANATNHVWWWQSYNASSSCAGHQWCTKNRTAKWNKILSGGAFWKDISSIFIDWSSDFTPFDFDTDLPIHVIFCKLNKLQSVEVQYNWPESVRRFHKYLLSENFPRRVFLQKLFQPALHCELSGMPAYVVHTAY